MTNGDFGEQDRIAVDTIRGLSMDAVQAANSGHPGMPMAMAPAAYLIYSRFLRHNPADPAWPDRDRFVLSAGHGSVLLYATLHLAGYAISLDDIKDFRQWGSITPGHPERTPEIHTPGVETTTGPLGQGFGNGVGMAIAEQFLRRKYGEEVVNHRVFGIVSDGDLMEGISSEAASLAGHLGLGKITYLYDDNSITIDGKTDISFTEDVGARFEAYGWHVETVKDVNDLGELSAAIERASADESRPSLIRVRTVIAYPSPNKQGTSGSHGAPLGDEEIRLTKAALGMDPDVKFAVPDEAGAAFAEARERGAAQQQAWRKNFERWRAADPTLAKQWDHAERGEFEPGLAADLPRFDPAETASIATRSAGGKALQAVAAHAPTLLGGSADLAGSVKSGLDGLGDFSATENGRNLHFGVREHAMGAAVNGLALHGGIVRPFGSTFLIFSDYMRGSIRLSALMRLHVTWVFSHDSLGVGEDGPTHQPIEQLASLRAIPGLTVLRPGDGAETSEAWRVIAEEIDGPAAIALSRQNLTVLDRTDTQTPAAGEFADATGVGKGAYTLIECKDPIQAVLVATGSEVDVALAARELLAADGIATRVVSMPSWELFEGQSDEYKQQVLPAELPKVSIEAGIEQGWSRFVDDSVSIERYGASAPGATVLTNLGITPEAAANKVRALL